MWKPGASLIQVFGWVLSKWQCSLIYDSTLLVYTKIAHVALLLPEGMLACLVSSPDVDATVSMDWCYRPQVRSQH